jgi:hypothetical protein
MIHFIKRLNATVVFALSAACFAIPGVVVEVYQSLFPAWEPGTHYANDTMQLLLSTGDLLGDLGVVLFIVGLIIWYREVR